MHKLLFAIILLSSFTRASASITFKEYSIVADEFLRFIVPFGQRWNPSYKRTIKLVPDPVFGAFAGEPITVHQGLIDDRSMTQDGLALVLCHEVGHNVELARFSLGGKLEYAFMHLEQDYFAVNACLFPFFEASAKVLPGRPASIEGIPLAISSRCHTEFRGETRVNDCLRAVRASQALSDGLYDYFQIVRPSGTLPKPTLERAWLGPKDELQARLLNFINGIFGDPPFSQKILSPELASPI